MRPIWLLATTVAVAGATPAAAQAALEGQQGSPPQTIDLLAPDPAEEPEYEDCSAEQQAASIAGEIIVCRRKNNGAEFGYDKDKAASRYAAETMDKGSPRAPDMEQHYPGPVVARGCFIPPCPPPPAYYFDITALPEPPPGSDAERIARGLPPLGTDAGEAPAVSPAGSASPAAVPPG